LYTSTKDGTSDLWFSDPPIWESLSDESYLVIFGDAHGRIDPGTSMITFWARFEYCPSKEPDDYPECEVAPTICTSTNHQLTLRRQ